jgi:hypothetical protein
MRIGPGSIVVNYSKPIRAVFQDVANHCLMVNTGDEWKLEKALVEFGELRLGVELGLEDTETKQDGSWLRWFIRYSNYS